jgi:hypothetical protein
MLSAPPAAQFGAALLAVAIATAATGASASTTPGVAPNYTFPDGSKGFAFMTTGGLLNPEVLVGFNPQPDPPGFGGSRDMTPGGGRVTQIATPLSDTGYGFLIALLNVGPDAMEPLPPAPNSDGNTGIAFMADGSVFRISLNFAGPGSVIGWAAFNPQPEPPGNFVGAQFGYPVAGDPVVTFSLTENERPLILTLAPAPEPVAWALMLIGIAGIGGVARAQSKGERSATDAA